MRSCQPNDPTQRQCIAQANYAGKQHLQKVSFGHICAETNFMGVSFRRQHAIGNYIVDFVSIKQKLIIELDGSQHLEQEDYDDERTRYFQLLGYKVIRFWNNAVMNDINGVIREIELVLLGK